MMMLVQSGISNLLLGQHCYAGKNAIDKATTLTHAFVFSNHAATITTLVNLSSPFPGKQTTATQWTRLPRRSGMQENLRM